MGGVRAGAGTQLEDGSLTWRQTHRGKQSGERGLNCPHEGEEKSSSAGMDGELSREGPEGSWGGGRGRTWSPPHAGRRARRRLSEAQRPELRTRLGGL